MPTQKSYSHQTKEATTLLGQLIQLRRKKRRWSATELASRAGISRVTLAKIEKGDPTCSIGLVFEAAALVGVPLFDSGQTPLADQLHRTSEMLALLPKNLRRSTEAVDDDF